MRFRSHAARTRMFVCTGLGCLQNWCHLVRSYEVTMSVQCLTVGCLSLAVVALKLASDGRLPHLTSLCQPPKYLHAISNDEIFARPPSPVRSPDITPLSSAGAGSPALGPGSNTGSPLPTVAVTPAKGALDVDSPTAATTATAASDTVTAVASNVLSVPAANVTVTPPIANVDSPSSESVHGDVAPVSVAEAAQEQQEEDDDEEPEEIPRHRQPPPARVPAGHRVELYIQRLASLTIARLASHKLEKVVESLLAAKCILVSFRLLRDADAYSSRCAASTLLALRPFMTEQELAEMKVAVDNHLLKGLDDDMQLSEDTSVPKRRLTEDQLNISANAAGTAANGYNEDTSDGDDVTLLDDAVIDDNLKSPQPHDAKQDIYVVPASPDSEADAAEEAERRVIAAVKIGITAPSRPGTASDSAEYSDGESDVEHYGTPVTPIATGATTAVTSTTTSQRANASSGVASPRPKSAVFAASPTAATTDAARPKSAHPRSPDVNPQPHPPAQPRSSATNRPSSRHSGETSPDAAATAEKFSVRVRLSSGSSARSDASFARQPKPTDEGQKQDYALLHSYAKKLEQDLKMIRQGDIGAIHQELQRTQHHLHKSEARNAELQAEIKRLQDAAEHDAHVYKVQLDRYKNEAQAWADGTEGLRLHAEIGRLQEELQMAQQTAYSRPQSRSSSIPDVLADADRARAKVKQTVAEVQSLRETASVATRDAESTREGAKYIVISHFSLTCCVCT
eukprot:TRINITY_DN5555_c0_g1_i1.p1 TRINITY_DN5555_c0_g1~~TRINITY_DN5555_c0_g1_i1.p1  ORF type:complete len:739 (+),score=179.75 TRINITY_DN5555_c0_g1_i1:344-2560(+)